MPSSIQVNLGEDEGKVKDRAKETLKAIIDLMNKYEEAYDKMLTSLESTNGYVSQGDGSPKFSVDAYHVKLRGDLGPAVDTKAVADLDKGYRAEYARVEKDIANILNVRGWGKMAGLTGVEEFFGDLTGQGFEFYAAKSHPYWGKLLRLRFQIHKLELIQQNIHQVTRAELERVFADRMILEDKVIDLENPPTALSSQLTGQGDEGAAPASPPLSATSQDDKDKTPGAHLASVGGRAAFVNQMITLMEGEYKALLSMILNMFDLDLALEPEAPATSLKVWTVMKATAAVGVKKDKDGKPQPVKLGKIGPDEVKKAVKNYHWEVWRKDQSGKYIERDTREPEVLLPLFEAGTFLLRVYAQGSQNIPLSESVEVFKVEPAEFSGNLQINGDFPGHALVQIKADGWMVDAVEVPAMARDWHQQLRLEVKKAQRVNKLDVKDLENKFYVDFEAWAWVDVPPKDMSERVVSQISPGLFTVPPDQPLVLNYPYNVEVTVKVVDASQTKVVREVEYLVTCGSQQLLVDHGFLKLKKDNVVKARAKYKHPPIILEKDGKDVIFDPADSKVIDFSITLPFFEEDHLLVRGDFVLPVDIDPPIRWQI